MLRLSNLNVDDDDTISLVLSRGSSASARYMGSLQPTQLADTFPTLARVSEGECNGCPWDETTCHNAAKGGHLEVLQWARQNGCPWNEWTCSYAAEGGHLEVLQWARENGCPWGKWTWDHANS